LLIFIRQHIFCLGTFVWQTQLGTFLGHAGLMPGYLTQIEYSKDYDIAVALQTNTDQGLGRAHHGYVQRVAQLIVEYLERR
jgi:hypothetical protein